MSQTILIVDDSPTVVKFLALSLKSKGYNIVAACDGMDALEKLSTLAEDVDLIITDLNMPNLDGYGLIKAVRQNRHTTPIIILSSEEDDEDQQRGMEVGANSYLVKPFKPAVLLGEVSRQLES
ncbi:MAG: response regulator [candidate division Zixibacteria bacterium]|nr:response regulator [candidate division Zixibacteria bacterium]